MQDKPPGYPGSFIQPNKEAGKRHTKLIAPQLNNSNRSETPRANHANEPRRQPAGTTGSREERLLPNPHPRQSAHNPPAKKQRLGTPESCGEVGPSAEDRAAAALEAARPKQNASSFKRPSHQERPRPAQVNLRSLERMEKAVLCGRLWHPTCRAANHDLPSDLPVSFPSASEYIAAYEPLIFEEARESLLHSKLDQYSLVSQATVVSLESLPSGWSEVRVSLATSSAAVKDGAVLVLSSKKLPEKASVEWFADFYGRQNGRKTKQQLTPAAGEVQTGAREDDLPIVAGVVRSAPSMGRGDVTVAIHPACQAHATETEAPCVKILRSLQPSRRMWAVVLSPMVTQQREFTALHKVPEMSVGSYMLHPEQLATLGAEVEEQHKGHYRLPRDCFGEGVMQRMHSQFDGTQFRAILAATRHLDLGREEKTMPVVLICGPPGTGKTHTVTGILNVWHLSHYTQHQNSIMMRLRADIERGDFARHVANSEHRVAGIASKPRLLVCAPSNAAADELLQRVMTSGFTGNDSRIYFPNVVRVGSPGANIGDKARAVLVDDLVAGFMNMEPGVWQHQVQQTRLAISQLTHNIAALQAHLSLLEIPEEEGPARDQVIRQEMDFIRQLVERHDARSRHVLQMDRLSQVADIVNGRPGPNLSEVRETLELLFVKDAEMVFTTLSSTGRKVFSRLEAGHFETVLIDEAAQASEVTTLQALTFGCRRVVLVGDPQQLPATVLSQKGKELLLERSLFERLQQAGCPVHMLQVQYRMHPHIREFPSNHFYHGRLQDGASVLSRPSEVFYKNEWLKPYAFFDVSEGRDVRASGGGSTGSRRNQEEADLAVALFQVLREELLAAIAKNELRKSVVVGVITPYKDQVVCIQDTFKRILGPQLASEVGVSTVDAYQGRQLDVIILSCVRAGIASSGVGFVADMRRMNVSITRAKRALWILGSAATLQQSPVWAALLNDARQRNALIPKAGARALFPHLPQFSADFRAHGSAPPPHGRREGLPVTDQQMQDAAAAPQNPAMMMPQLQHGVAPLRHGDRGGIPGLGLQLPGPKRKRHRSKQESSSREGSRDPSSSADEANLYGDSLSGLSSRQTSRGSTPNPTPSTTGSKPLASKSRLAQSTKAAGGDNPSGNKRQIGAQAHPSKPQDMSALANRKDHVAESQGKGKGGPHGCLLQSQTKFTKR